MTNDELVQRLKELRVEREALEGQLEKVCNETFHLNKEVAVKRVLEEAASLCNVALQSESDPARTLAAAYCLRSAARKLRDTSHVIRSSDFQISVP